ncbi:MAG: ATP-binding protein [Acidimicrobiales bacterium]
MDVMTRASSGDGRSRRDRRAFRASTSSARAIRGFVRDTLRHAQAPAQVIDDLELVASELAANAIEHGTGTELTIEVDGSQRRWWELVVISSLDVSRDAGRMRATRTWEIAGAEASSGRGLGIVRRLMDDVSVERDHDRLVVRCRLRRS